MSQLIPARTPSASYGRSSASRTTPPIALPVGAWTRLCVSLAADRSASLQLPADLPASPTLGIVLADTWVNRGDARRGPIAHPLSSRKKGDPIMSLPTTAAFGDMAVDATDVKCTFLTNDQIRHYSKVRPGFERALTSLLLLTAAQAKSLGISDDDLTEAAALKPDLDRLAQLLPVVEEILRRLHSTNLDRCHRVAVILHSVAATARRRAERDPDANLVLGSLLDLLAYVSEPGKKAAATRAKQGSPKKKSSKLRHAPPQAAPDDDGVKPSPAST
jgi:hypothetical protein